MAASLSSVKFILLAVVMVMAVLVCSFSVADSASVQHHHHSQHQQRIARSPSNKEDDGVSQCGQSTPCGWAVYARFTRTVDYFMKNTCVCETGLECIRVDDDVSVSAYVYKCRNVSNGNGAGGASTS